jgi:hypothetical protein
MNPRPFLAVLSVPFILFSLALIPWQAVQAMPSFANDLARTCVRAGYPQPALNTVTCTACHGGDDPASGGGREALLDSGRVYQQHLEAPSSRTLAQLANTFCKGAYYNLQFSETDRLNNGALPPQWNRDPGEFSYRGTLPVHWLAELGGDNQRLELSLAEASRKTAGLPDTFNLLASPENCWGEKMNFGLIRLTQKANLTLRAEADGSQASSLIPGFALYRGWDRGPNSQHHDTIVFGDNNPLSSEGLTFMGQALASQVGEAAETTLVGLEPGLYEMLMTVGTNRSSLGEYRLILTTTPPTLSLSLTKTGAGTVKSDRPGIDCGTVCSAAFDPGTRLTLTATANSGHRFTGWEGCPDVTAAGVCRVTLTASTGVVARFEPILQRLTLKTPAAGKIYSLDSRISCGVQTLGLCQALYPEGTRVTLFAQGDFRAWTGACAGQNKRCEVTLDADVCVAARFGDDRSSPCEVTQAVSPPACGVKANQVSLILSPGLATLKPGDTLTLNLQGGSGSGVIRLRQTATPGTACRLTRKGMQISLIARGKPGTCTVVATKAASPSYNAAESAPVTVTVTP